MGVLDGFGFGFGIGYVSMDFGKGIREFTLYPLCLLKFMGDAEVSKD
jgi:hypothetical protein